MDNLFLVIIGVAIVISVVYIVRRFSHYTLLAKLVIAFLAVALIPLMLQVFLNNRIAQTELTNEANQALFAAASQTANSVDAFMTTNLNTIRTEAELPLWADYLSMLADQKPNGALEAEVRDTLRALSHKTNISSYALLDLEGRTVMDTFASHTGLDRSDRQYFQIPLKSGLPYVSPVEFSPVTGNASLYFSSPIRSSARKIVGVLRIRYDASVLQQLIVLNNNLAGEKSFAVLFDENHIHLAHGTAPDVIFKGLVPFDPIRLAALRAARRLPNLPAGELSINLSDLDQNLANVADQPYFTAVDIATGDEVNQVAVASTTRQPWLVAFFQPRDVFLASVEAQTRSTLFLSAPLIMVVVVAALGMSQFLARPIARLTMVAQRVAAGDLEIQAVVESQDETGRLATAFNSMTMQLRESISSLEQQVAARTRRLETAAVLSERLNATLDFDQLLQVLVDEIKEKFNYYHAQVYTIDNNRQNLVMTVGIGEAGAQMKAMGHAIPFSSPTSLVARAARSGEIVSVDNVREAEDWLPNPLLPDTYSEMAVPIILEGQVVGVLDVQQNEVAGLDEGDASLLRSLANQVSIAIRNARLFAEVEAALVEARAAQEKYIQHAWNKISVAPDVAAHLHTRSAVTALPEATMAAAKRLALSLKGPAIVALDGDEANPKSIVTPITLSGQTIGVLQLHQPEPDDDDTETHPWTDEDLALIEAVVDQVAQTAENLRLFEETRQRAGREQLARQITDKIRSSRDLEIAMKTAAEEISNALNLSTAKISWKVRPEDKSTDQPQGAKNGATNN